MNDWAPPGIAWDRDNVGLQVGSTSAEVTGIVFCLDLTEGALDKAVSEGCNLVITHHPMLFMGVKRINPEKDPLSRMIQKAIKNDITILSHHTNLDFTPGGVNYVMAQKLGLENIRTLAPLEKKQFKISVFVPADAVDAVAEAMFSAGAGRIGEYEKCSYRTKGQGTFFGSDASNPAVGEKGKLEFVDEERLEVIVDEWNLEAVREALITAHPYEEPAYDIFPVENRNTVYGPGAVGELKKPLPVKDFLKKTADTFGIQALRHSAPVKDTVTTIAMTGGTGFEFMSYAVKSGADVFITADVKYHQFQQAAGKLLLIDAGHYETEVHVLDELQQRIENLLAESGERLPSFVYGEDTNPVHYYILQEGV